MKIFVYYDKSMENHFEDVALICSKSEHGAKNISLKYFDGIVNPIFKEIVTEGKNLPEIEFISEYKMDSKLQ